MSTPPYTPFPGILPGPGYRPTGLQIDPGSPFLAYFIIRGNGVAVPLIAVDELPSAVRLENIPRVLTPQETYGMQYVGTSPYTGATFKLETAARSSAMIRSTSQPMNEPSHARSHTAAGAKQYLAPDALARQALANPSYAGPDIGHMRQQSAHESAKSWRRTEPVESADATQRVIDAVLRSQAGVETAERVGYRIKDSTPSPSGVIPDQDKKIFCTHWIMTGDCKFVQQGCRYKHEMPSEAKLKELGIRHTPRWWLEQNSAIKHGGARNVSGPRIDPLEMLCMGNDGDTDSENSSNESEKTVGKKFDIVKKPAAKTTGSAENIIAPPGVSRLSTPNFSPERTSTTGNDALTTTRKPSTASSDLIDFTPLVETSSGSTDAPTITTPASDPNQRSISPIQSAAISAPIKSQTQAPQTPPKSKKVTKVFVPAGESPEKHIAEAKTRERSTAPKHQQGLQASKHAPAPAASPKSTSSAIEKSAPTTKRNKAGCRLRRPAPVPGPAATVTSSSAASKAAKKSVKMSNGSSSSSSNAHVGPEKPGSEKK